MNIRQVFLDFIHFLVPRCAKSPSGPSGCASERRLLRCDACQWKRHWLRAAPCIHPFSHTTQFTLKVRQAARIAPLFKPNGLAPGSLISSHSDRGKMIMRYTLHSLARWTQRRRQPLRLLILVAIAALFVDGFLVERSFVHLILLHPVLLLALLGALTLTGSHDE
jgi:hypothetical protein